MDLVETREKWPDVSDEVLELCNHHHLSWEGHVEHLQEVFHHDMFNFTHWESHDAGVAGVRAMILSVRSSFPDLRVEVADLFHQGDKVAARVQMAGTHLGPYGTLAPTGRRAEWTVLAIWHLRDGKVFQEWALPDEASLLRQLGAELQTPKVG